MASVGATSRNIQKVAEDLFESVEQRERFLTALARREGRITAVAWLSEPRESSSFKVTNKPEWLPSWIDVAEPTDRPGASSEHEAGAIYCLDLSSAFVCAALRAIAPEYARDGVVVDMCAAPGGKGIVARRYLSPQILIGNEVIRKRTAPLISNYKRCDIDPALVTSCDPKVLAESIPGSAALVIVDAPCSGQSLILKDHEAPGAFHPATISMNARRQHRIMAYSSALVRPGGYMLYSTCTFSREENEDNLQWFLKTFPEFEACSVEGLEPHRSHLTEIPCYRLWPHEGVGTGAFCGLLRRTVDAPGGVGVSADNFADLLQVVWRSPTLFAASPPRSVGGDPENRGRSAQRKGKGWKPGSRGRAQRRAADEE